MVDMVLMNYDSVERDLSEFNELKSAVAYILKKYEKVLENDAVLQKIKIILNKDIKHEEAKFK